MPKPKKTIEEGVVGEEQTLLEVAESDVETHDDGASDDPETENEGMQDDEGTYVEGRGYVELERSKEVFDELVKRSAKANYEKVGVTTYDEETFVTLRMSVPAYEAIHSILLTLRTEYQLTLELDGKPLA